MKKAPNAIASTAVSRSASSSTSAGALPPSSSSAGFRCFAACTAMMRPTCVDPVKFTRRTARCAINRSTMAAASSGALVTTLTTPSPSPASWNTVPIMRCTAGHTSDALSTTVLPHASGIAMARVPRITGAFQGAMPSTTPHGWRTASARLPGISVGITLPSICVVIAAASRSMFAARWTLKPYQFAIAPVSGIPAAMKSPVRASMMSAALSNRARRSEGVSAAQAGNARAAASTAASASLSVAAGAREATTPMTGSRRSNVAPFDAARSCPPTNMLTSFTVLSPERRLLFMRLLFRALVCLQTRLDRFLVEELLQALRTPLLRITVQRLIELRVQVVLVLLPRQFPGTLEAVLRRTQHHGILLQQLRRELRYFIAQLCAGHALVDEAHRCGFRTREGVARHDVMQRLTMAHRVGHCLAHEVTRRNAPVDFRKAEDRFVRCDSQITRNEWREATTEAPSVHHRNGRLCVHAQELPLPLAGVAADLLLKNFRARVHFAEILLQVHARGPGVTRAGQHEHARICIQFERLENLNHLAVERGAHCIALFRAIEHHPGDARFHFHVNGFPATFIACHAFSPAPRGAKCECVS
ncbi:protein of unknown function (plasmid) [Caballeronia sp. S22]